MSEKSEELLNSGTSKGSAVNPTATGTPGKDENDAGYTSFLATAMSESHQVDSDKVRQEEEWRSELFKLENEITTLRTVLNCKYKEADELKRKLGITPLVEFRDNVKHGFNTIKESEPIQRTSAAFKDFGEYASKKLEDIKNSNTYKSVEEKVGVAYSNIKRRASNVRQDSVTDETLDNTPSMKPTKSDSSTVATTDASAFTKSSPDEKTFSSP